MSTHILLQDDKDKQIITIIGKKESVETAKAQLEAIIREVNNNTESEMEVDQKHHKHFVAKRGEVINRISEECGGVTISFPRAADVESKKVTLKGPKEGIEAAKQRILEIVEDLQAMVTIECVIPKKHHRSVMGKRGAKVQQITSDFDVQVKFPEQKSETNGDVNGDIDATADVIKITGKAEKCEQAKQGKIDFVILILCKFHSILFVFLRSSPRFGSNH